ncbi:tyrosine-type recombinase/integrase [Saccharopolyspora sp. NPDC047091]|uniref:tyrosine-type recombinase/integrase n=1 Tax=Saccharopolyspora sp. NPDC047091 TaxID=3155924 RepID=UPI0033E753AB
MADIDDRWHRKGPDGAQHRTDRYGVGARWLLRWREPDGTQRKKSFRRKTDAEQYATTVEHGMMSGSYISPGAGKITVGEWTAQWLTAQAHVKPTSRNRSEGIVRTHVLPKWERVRLSDVSHAAVQGWIGELGAGLAPASVAKVHRVFSQVMGWAVRNGRLASNPAEGVNLPRVVTTDHRYLNHDQVARLADACEPNGLVIRLLAYTGLRWGEMAALRTANVDLDRRRIRVAQSVTEVSGRLEWGTPKNHERRSVPLPRFLADQLAKHLGGKAADDLVFASPKGGVLRVRNFRRAVFDRAVREVGPAGFHPHELRHTAASLAIASGADVKLVQQMLGHKSATMTLDLYGHLFPDRLDDLADRMDAAVSAPDVPQSGS